MSVGSSLAGVDVLGVRFAAGRFGEVVEELAAAVKNGVPFYVTFTGVHGVMESQRRPEVLAAHRNARLVACDGMPTVWASRWAGAHDAERTYGPDFMLAFCERAAAVGWTSFFYGGADGIAERLAKQLQMRYPGLRVAGTYSPPFRALSTSEDADAVATINASRADLVWVGLGTPMQELWMEAHAERLPGSALFGVGAAFDFLSGAKPQAPRWMQRAGLEWLFRMVVEPRRLAKRYLTNIPAFLCAIARQHPSVSEGPATAPGQ